MTRDMSKYYEPERFNPDRFFTLDGHLSRANMRVLSLGGSYFYVFSFLG